MNDIVDLRRTLDQHAGSASDLGVVVRRVAVHHRIGVARRRRRAAAAGGIVAVTAGAPVSLGVEGGAGADVEDLTIAFCERTD